jgi:two-component system NtrC family response regulator
VREQTVASILIIDDEEHIRDILSARVEALGHRALCASSIQEGLRVLEGESVDLVFLDVNLPDGSGLDALPSIRESAGSPEVIIITAAGSSRGAEMAINNGAWDYIEKPFYKDALILHIQRALDYRAARRKQAGRVLLETDDILGRSRALKNCLEQVAKSASGLANVLIQGASGTGKELFARAIHDNSGMSRGNYVVVDCAALPETLVESLLFGHRKGAFTGADRDSEGLVKMADNGTLFLDEVGELPLAVQKIFLRVLQEKRFRPVGSPKEMKSGFRLVSATNRDLDAMAAQGAFRTDLLHRLKTVVIQLPALRDREGDIGELAVHYTNQLCARHGLPRKVLSPDTLEVLESYDWPGNVRELVHALEKAVLSDPGVQLVYPMHLPGPIRLMHVKKGLHAPGEWGSSPPWTKGRSSAPRPEGPPDSVPDGVPSLPSFKAFRNLALDGVEREYFTRLLSETGWDLDAAALRSGLSKNRVYYFIRRHGLRKD